MQIRRMLPVINEAKILLRKRKASKSVHPAFRVNSRMRTEICVPSSGARASSRSVSSSVSILSEPVSRGDSLLFFFIFIQVHLLTRVLQIYYNYKNHYSCSIDTGCSSKARLQRSSIHQQRS